MKYDVIIVGGGTAGCILAARLTEEEERSVLLLEAGPDYSSLEELPEEIKFARNFGSRELLDSKHNWQFVARATDKFVRMPVARGKVTGGSSAINAAGILRGVPEDYDGWASMGNDLWSFEQVLPYFIKLEKDLDFQNEFHGVDGPIPVRRDKREEWLPTQVAFYNACLAAGYPDCPDHNRPDSSGVGPVEKNLVNDVRYSTAIGYLSQCRGRPNLTIKSDSTVHRVLFNGRRATGVVVESGGEMITVEGAEIVLSAGAIGSPQLLMLSGVGPVELLKNHGIAVVQEMPGVGQNLRDHARIPAVWRTVDDFPMDAYAPRSQVQCRYTAQGSHLRNDIIVSMISFVPERPERGGDFETPLGIGLTVGLARPLGCGQLRITSTDPNTQPYIDYNYLVEPFDRARLREAVHRCLDLAGGSDFKDIIKEPIEPTKADFASPDALDQWLLREVTTFNHISCTCKMGPDSDPMAVVDQYGKVHGLEALRIVDASIMPNIPAAHINATVMMIGERVADLIRQGW